MSLAQCSYFGQSNLSAQSLIQSSTPNHQLLHTSLTLFDADILMSQFAPIANSPIVPHSP
ncbi:unnamed protein product, partial [Rotaria magnacalcarata]